MMPKIKKNGFTLIETIIYIAILAFLIASGVMSAFYIIDSSGENKIDVNVQAEGNFILRKIDWALTGATDASVAGSSLTITKTSGPYIFSFDGSQYLQLGGTNLNSSRVTISSVVFSVSGSPKKITVSFNVNGKPFAITKYLRI